MLKSKTTTYELGKEELKDIMACQLNVPRNTIEVNFKDKECGDDRGATWRETYAVEFVVKPAL